MQGVAAKAIALPTVMLSFLPKHPIEWLELGGEDIAFEFGMWKLENELEAWCPSLLACRLPKELFVRRPNSARSDVDME